MDRVCGQVNRAQFTIEIVSLPNHVTNSHFVAIGIQSGKRGMMRTSMAALRFGTALLAFLAPAYSIANADRRAGIDAGMIGEGSTSRTGDLEAVKPVFQLAIPTMPGKQLIAVVVSYPPGGKSPPHRHAKSAFIYAYVLSGAMRSAINAERPVIYHTGDSFHEEPGAHHSVSENASSSQPASLLAVFVVDTDDLPLMLPDPKTD
jgi:quercetin dioxygenase-like cupin family protein